MPEGDTIHRAAKTLHRALAGRIVTRFDSMYPALNRVNDDQPLKGRTIEAVTARGKHLLMTFSNGLVLRTHMRMNGSWHIYRPGERWQAPARDMRVLIETDTYVAVGFNVPVAEFLTADGVSRHEQLRALGPDLADPAFDRDELMRRLRAHDSEPLYEVLLNQQVVAGIGNVLKSEILFVSRLDPFSLVSSLNPEQIDRLIETARRLMKMNIANSDRTLSSAIGRRTTGSLNPNVKLWVSGRGGQPCRRCGATIQSRKTGADARLTYWCATCQS